MQRGLLWSVTSFKAVDCLVVVWVLWHVFVMSKDVFISFSKILRECVVRASDHAGSVQVFDSFGVETFPALLYSLSGALHHSHATVSKNPEFFVSPKWSQSQSWPKQDLFRQEPTWLHRVTSSLTQCKFQLVVETVFVVTLCFVSSR